MGSMCETKTYIGKQTIFHLHIRRSSFKKQENEENGTSCFFAILFWRFEKDSEDPRRDAQRPAEGFESLQTGNGMPAEGFTRPGPEGGRIVYASRIPPRRFQIMLFLQFVAVQF